MAVVVTITGVAGVTDDETDEPLADPKKVRKVAKLWHKEAGDLMADYLDADLEEIGITGGDLRLSLDPTGKTFLIVSTFKAPRKLTNKELARLVEETTGQWSDGLGEGCFGDAADELGVTIDLLQRKKPKAVQVDDGKPVKAKKPPGAKAVRVEEFVRAADAGDLDKVNELIAAGVPPDAANKLGVTALYCAAGEGRVDVAEALLAAGADVNAIMPKGYCKGTTALTAAAMGADKHKDKNVAVVKRLLAAGADPNVVPTTADTKSALSWAVLNHAPQLLKVLLAGGADPNVRDADTDMRSEPTGMTPLMHVMDTATARMLLDAGADPSLRNGYESAPTAAEYLRSVYGHYRGCRAAADFIDRYRRPAAE
jgi:ankyrin repeat protein